MSQIFHALETRHSRASFIRALLNGLQHIPQISHPKTGVKVRSRFDHTRNMCKLARLLHGHFGGTQNPLWPQLCLRLACHDIGHTPYGHAGERVIQQNYDPDFSNSGQSRRYMFAGTEDWPEGVVPFFWYRSAPITRLTGSLEEEISTLVNFFDDLENAVGDAIDLHVMGQSEAFNFLVAKCSWSDAVCRGSDQPEYLKQVVIHEFAPTGFSDLALRIKAGNSASLQSIATLRVLIAEQRHHCAHIARIDAAACRRIPALFDQAQTYLRARLPAGCCDDFMRRVAVDITASTNELELA